MALTKRSLALWEVKQGSVRGYGPKKNVTPKVHKLDVRMESTQLLVGVVKPILYLTMSVTFFCVSGNLLELDI